MARQTTRHVCQSCGAVHPRWAGRCEACGDWNSIVEEAKPDAPPIGGKGAGARGGARRIEFVALEGKNQPMARRKSGIGEFDRVAGGGLVPGSALLIGGDPGIDNLTLTRVVGRAEIVEVGRQPHQLNCAFTACTA